MTVPIDERKKMKHDIKIHSQIHGPKTKPVHIGWYPSVRKWFINTLTCEISNNLLEYPWYWWDGTHWRYSPEGTVLHYQDRCWFGLRGKP